MITHKSITRRLFIVRALLSGLIAVVIPRLILASPVEHIYFENLANRLGSVIKNKHSSYFVGREYLKQKPWEADKKMLIELIFRDKSKIEDILNGDNNMLRRFLVDRIHDDYTRGETVSVRRWILSQTEARIYALSALS